MRKKTFLFLLIVFVTVGLIAYFNTQPVIQAQDAPGSGDEAIKGTIYYAGIDCHFSWGDHVDVYRLTGSGADWVAAGQVRDYGGSYNYVVTATDLDNQRGYYRLVPDLQTASGNIGVSPHVRDSVWWQGPVIYNQNFTADAC